MPPGSEPASGSDSAKAAVHSPAAQRGRKRCFCSSVPKSLIGSVPSSCTASISALEAHALAISSMATLSISVPVPVPPYSSSNGSPNRSWWANSSRMSHGYSVLASISAARGATRSRTICRIVSRKSICSGVSSYWMSAGAVVMDGDRMGRRVWNPRGRVHRSCSPPRKGPLNMGIGTSIFLIAVGAILRWGVSDAIDGVDLPVIGLILMICGVLGLASRCCGPTSGRATAAASAWCASATSTSCSRLCASGRAPLPRPRAQL